MMQEIFTRVYVHLLKQNCRSVRDGRCCYRGPNGTVCAVGVLIKDEHYMEVFDKESYPANSPYIRMALNNSGIVYEKESQTEHLLAKLQRVHDSYSPEEWPHQLDVVAKDFGLEVPLS